METMTPLSVIALAPENKAEIDQFTSFITNQVEEGFVDPLEVYLQCTAMEKAMENIKKLLQKSATSEAEKYGKGEFERKSFTIRVGEVGSKYVYDNCNDPILRLRESQSTKAKEQFEARQLFLKSLKEPLRIVDEETGDSFVVNPPAKTSTTSVIVKMK